MNYSLFSLFLLLFSTDVFARGGRIARYYDYGGDSGIGIVEAVILLGGLAGLVIPGGIITLLFQKEKADIWLGSNQWLFGVVYVLYFAFIYYVVKINELSSSDFMKILFGLGIATIALYGFSWLIGKVRETNQPTQRLSESKQLTLPPTFDNIEWPIFSDGMSKRRYTQMLFDLNFPKVHTGLLSRKDIIEAFMNIPNGGLSKTGAETYYMKMKNNIWT